MGKVCLRIQDPSLEAYLAIGGYQVWEKLIKGEIALLDALAEIKASMLSGRGGAGFLTGLKWGFMNREAAGEMRGNRVLAKIR